MSAELPDIDYVGVLGPEWTYSDILAKQANPGLSIKYHQSFDEGVEDVQNNPQAALWLPMVNTLDGPVNPNVRHLMSGELAIIGAAVLQVSVDVMGLKDCDEDEIREVWSNGKALGQASDYIHERGWLEEKIESTAGAASKMAANERHDVAVLGAGILAGVYGLRVIAEDVQNQVGDGINETNFLLVQSRNGYKVTSETADSYGAQLISGVLRLNLPKGGTARSGTLAHALDHLQRHGLNLADIESVVIPGTRERSFFLTYEATGHGLAMLLNDQNVAVARGAEINREPKPSIDVLGIYLSEEVRGYTSK